MLEQCSFCIENDTTISAGEKHVEVCQCQKSQSTKMILVEIKTSCNLFEISPIDNETQPYLEKFCRDFFLLISPIITVEFLQVQEKNALFELSRVY